MASVMQCDRCGNCHDWSYGYINDKSVNEIIFARRDHGAHNPAGKFSMDLCPACVYELAEWLNAKKEKNDV